MTRALPIPPLVLVDTREQRPVEPYTYDAATGRKPLATTRLALPFGDYSLALDELRPRLFLDRKSVGDLIGTCTGARLNSVGESESARDRFERAIDRAVAATPPDGRQIRAIVIEGQPADVWREGAEEGRRFTPLSVFASLQAWHHRYNIAPIWAHTPDGAAWWIGRCLAAMWEEHTGGAAARKAARDGWAAMVPWVREAPSEAALEIGARAALRLTWWAELDGMDEGMARRREAELCERRERGGDRSDAGDDLIRVRRRLAALQQPASERRFAPAGGMPLSHAAADTARRAARATR